MGPVRVGVALAAVVILPTMSASAASPQELLASMIAAGKKQHALHYVTTSSAGKFSSRMVADVAADRGIQRVSFRSGSRSGRATVVVAHRTAYVKGDAFTLVGFMGFKAKPSAKYAGVWIRIPHTDRDFPTVAAAVTLASAMGELKPRGPLTSVPETTIGGQRVLGVRGKTTTLGRPAPETLYGRATGEPLPVLELVPKAGAGFKVVLGPWNQSIHAPVPRRSVPISKTGLE